MTDNRMHDHNLDLIMALAEGTLDEPARLAAEAQIAACDGCGVELEAQRLALDALRAAPAPELTMLEAMRMRRDLRQELGIAEPAATTPTRRRAGARWQRLSVALSAAAVLLLVVAVVPALDLFGAGESADDVAFASTTVAAPLTEDSITSAAGMADEPPVSSPASGDREMPGTVESAPQLWSFGGSWDADEIRDAARRGLEETGDVRNLLGYRGGDLDVSFIHDGADLCVAAGVETKAAGTEAVVLGSGEFADAEVVVVVFIETATGAVDVVAYDVDGCSVVTSSG